MSEIRKLEWHRVAAVDELAEGRVRSLVVGERSLALTHFEGTYSAPADAVIAVEVVSDPELV